MCQLGRQEGAGREGERRGEEREKGERGGGREGGEREDRIQEGGNKQNEESHTCTSLSCPDLQDLLHWQERADCFGTNEWSSHLMMGQPQKVVSSKGSDHTTLVSCTSHSCHSHQKIGHICRWGQSLGPLQYSH